MSSIIPTSVAGEVHYPSEDGEPMAETPLHRKVMIDSIATLEYRFADDPMVYVSGNMLMYYVEGDPLRSVAPDVLMVRGVPKDTPREVYLVWKEKKAPDAVIEVSSKSTAQVDQEEKFHLYQNVLKVREYFLFDPREEYLDPPLQGYRLQGGRYVQIDEVDDRLPSEVLGLHLERAGEQLRFYDPGSRKRLLTLEERIERAETARRKEAEARKKETAARKNAEAERQREAAARKKAEAERQHETAARQKAEAEAEKLRREIEELRRQLPKRP